MKNENAWAAGNLPGFAIGTAAPASLSAVDRSGAVPADEVIPLLALLHRPGRRTVGPPGSENMALRKRGKSGFWYAYFRTVVPGRTVR